jgi:class 3 adenylate cyclase
MSTPENHLAILFADIAGSTRLYEKLGDVIAHECVIQSLDHVSSIVGKHGGVVVEIVGDEIMCYFASIAAACRCACDVQSAFEHFRTSHGHTIGLRIGFHAGQTKLDFGHPFGDTVNVAARVSALAHSGQILTTEDTTRWLPPELQAMCRLYNRVHVKGKTEPLDMREVIWNQDDATSIFSPSTQGRLAQAPEPEIELCYNGRQLRLSEAAMPFLIGRGEHCNLIVPSDTASRSHARLEARFGEFVLIDHSTNGTYIKTEPGKRNDDGLDIHLHHREWTVTGNGEICLGRPIRSGDPSIITFRNSH